MNCEISEVISLYHSTYDTLNKTYNISPILLFNYKNHFQNKHFLVKFIFKKKLICL
jgi:hypothetical protein